MSWPREAAPHDGRSQLQGLDEVFKVGALAADVKAHALDHQPAGERFADQIHGLARVAAELARQLHHRAGVGNPQPQHQTGVRRVLADLGQFRPVVEGHQRPVLVQRLQCLFRFDRIGVDDLVPNVLLPLGGRQVLDVLVHQLELRQGGDVEARAGAVQRAHDFGRRVGLHGVVGLHLRQVPAERGVVAADDVVVDDDHRRALLPGDRLQLARGHKITGSLPSTILTLLWAKYSRVKAFTSLARWSYRRLSLRGLWRASA